MNYELNWDVLYWCKVMCNVREICQFSSKGIIYGFIGNLNRITVSQLITESAVISADLKSVEGYIVCTWSGWSAFASEKGKTLFAGLHFWIISQKQQQLCLILLELNKNNTLIFNINIFSVQISSNKSVVILLACFFFYSVSFKLS